MNPVILEPLTKRDKIAIPLREVSQRVRKQLKAEFPETVFSVRTEYYSMGQALHVSVMQTPLTIVRPLSTIPERLIKYTCDRGYTREQLERTQASRYHQLNQYMDDYDPDKWNNGVFLTEDGHRFLKRVLAIINHYNYDDSDSQTDYYDVHFSLHFNLGKWDAPMIQREALTPQVAP